MAEWISAKVAQTIARRVEEENAELHGDAHRFDEGVSELREVVERLESGEEEIVNLDDFPAARGLLQHAMPTPDFQVVDGAQRMRESLTSLGVPVTFNLSEDAHRAQALLFVDLPDQHTAVVTVGADDDGPVFDVQLLDGDVDSPPVGEWELRDPIAAAVLVKLAHLGPGVVDSERARLGMPDASVGDLAVAMTSDQLAGDPWSPVRPQVDQDQTVKVYTSSGCVACLATKRQLDKGNVTYTEVDVRADQAALDELKAMGYLELPVVVDGNQHWSGYRPDKVAALVTKHAPPTAPEQAPRATGLDGPGV